LAAALGGLERMYRWHHLTGVAAYVLLLVHPLALAAANLKASPRLAWQTLSPTTEGWPVWSGWIGLGLLMAGLAITFDRRIGYGLWRWLHAALGFGVVVGLVHLVLLGIDEPVLPILAVAAGLLGWRLLRGDLGLAARPYLVIERRELAVRTIDVVLQPLGEPPDISAGQFVLIAFSDGPLYRGCGEFHPFTVTSVGRDGKLHIAVKAVGDCTTRMLSLVSGVEARVIGGFGGFSDVDGDAPQLWVAGGIGITPFMARLSTAPLRHPVHLLYLYRREQDAAFLPELRTLAATDPNLTLHEVATGDALPDIDPLLPPQYQLAGTECLLCGPAQLVAQIEPGLQARGVAPRRIHYENFEFR
ncbi:ferredoxin reductase family protein, partial [Rhodopseudomonas sp. B29]|uniref:ferric reductase-like transmembrane domain-containing protein n=1 Tax=Rhodopseudomonas sp. B29 TaxID=95607 RepID=UPI0003B513A3